MNQIQKHQNLNKHLDLVAELYLREMIRKEYPDWVDFNGECEKCDQYYDSLLDTVEIKWAKLMNTIKEQFYKTTEQYFQGNYENIVQSENRKPEPEIKKYYIKEGPFINSNEME